MSSRDAEVAERLVRALRIAYPRSLNRAELRKAGWASREKTERALALLVDEGTATQTIVGYQATPGG